MTLTDLERYRQLKIRHEEAIQMIEELRGRATPGSPALDGMPHGSGISKPTEEKAVKLADKRQRLIRAENDAIEIRDELFDFINSIDGDEGRVLYLRYIKLHLWRDIAEKMNFTERAVFQIHARALRIVDEKRSL